MQKIVCSCCGEDNIRAVKRWGYSIMVTTDYGTICQRCTGTDNHIALRNAFPERNTTNLEAKRERETATKKLDMEAKVSKESKKLVYGKAIRSGKRETESKSLPLFKKDIRSR